MVPVFRPPNSCVEQTLLMPAGEDAHERDAASGGAPEDDASDPVALAAHPVDDEAAIAAATDLLPSAAVPDPPPGNRHTEAGPPRRNRGRRWSLGLDGSRTSRLQLWVSIVAVFIALFASRGGDLPAERR